MDEAAVSWWEGVRSWARCGLPSVKMEARSVNGMI